MDTVEGNKMISEFLNLRKKDVPSRGACFIVEQFIYDRINNDYAFCWPVNKMKYHSSWDWLHPVLDKLNSLLSRYVFVQNSHSTILRGSNGKNSFDFNTKGTDSIQAFELLVKAIQWHNQQLPVAVE